MAGFESLVDGVPCSVVPVLDRGLAFGDGLFETLAVHHGRPLRWEAHMHRLLQGCRRLGIEMPPETVLLAELERVCAGRGPSVAKILLTRGRGERGYRVRGTPTPTRVVLRFPWPQFRQGALRLCVCRTRLGINPRLAGIKHLNRLEQVLARQEWGDEYDEGLMLDQTDAVVECVASNLFLWRDDALFTPLVDRAGVDGVMRRAVLEAARSLGISVHVQRFGLEAVRQAEGVFITNAVTGLRWVAQIGDWRYREPFPLAALAAQTESGVRQP